MALETDVLVVGAGPIGLINAWGLKRLNPNLKIVILEKYAEYQRSHTLIMQAKQLEAIMKATHSEKDPTLAALLSQLKKDPNIRTNHLQQIFTNLAWEIGVEIKTEHAIQKDTIYETLKEYSNASLIIGADGTHSVVSASLFPEGNQVKHEFDFVLQLRFEIKGKEKAPGINIKHFYQFMARKGLIANEYVGHFDGEKTPVTMQVMISRKDFFVLQRATSKSPLRFSTTSGEEKAEMALPPHLNSFISTYLNFKVKDTVAAEQQIEKESIRISVNEAPATHAKQVVAKHDNAYVILEGDSALGLSYFKGLNAGLEASAKFLTTMSHPIKDSFRDKEAMARQLGKYQSWFLRDFSPKKVKEVASYSFWQIRSFMKAIRVANHIKGFSVPDYNDDPNSVLIDYFNFAGKDSSRDWRAFPHREYDPVKFAQLDYIPLKHTAKKIIKNFTDFFRPYKSHAHIIQDFKQPLIGIGNMWGGLGKILDALLTLNSLLLADGVFHIIRGALELITTPLTYLLKPITRGIATLVHGGYQKAEENTGMQTLAKYGLDYLGKMDDSELLSNQTIYELRALCNDMHRKFDKSIIHGQATKLDSEESKSYAEIRVAPTIERQKLAHYFSLFAPQKSERAVSVKPEGPAI